MADIKADGSFEAQRLIVVALMVIFNFIRENVITNQEFKSYEEDKDSNASEDTNVAPDPLPNN